MKKIFYLLSIILASAVLLISVHNKPRQDIFEANIEALAATENTTGKRDCFWNVKKDIIPGIFITVRNCNGCRDEYASYADTDGDC